MASLKPWDGRQLCSMRLSDKYIASSATIEIMRTGITFTKGVAEPHPESQRKDINLTFAEASDLSDGRFEIAPVVAAPVPAIEASEPKKKSGKAESQE